MIHEFQSFSDGPDAEAAARCGVLGWCARLIGWLCAAAVLAWMIGRVFTDHWTWSQWLWWIPTPVIIVIAAAGWCSAVVRRGSRRACRRRRFAWTGMMIAMAGYFGIIEHRMLRGANPNPTGVKIVHWNMTQAIHAVPMAGDVLERELKALDGDVTVMTSPGGVAWQPTLHQALGNTGGPVFFFPMAMVTRLRVVEARQAVAAEGVWINLIVLDASETLGRNLVIYMIDLPSNPGVSRAALARRARELMDMVALPEPDVVIGDFNIPRNSWSLGVAFPGTHNAFEEGGHGYGATFDRRLPMLHIDNVLLGPAVRATRYDVVDTGVGRHRAQACWVDTVNIGP